jgi:hypothetical protein
MIIDGMEFITPEEMVRGLLAKIDKLNNEIGYWYRKLDEVDPKGEIEEVCYPYDSSKIYCEDYEDDTD